MAEQDKFLGLLVTTGADNSLLHLCDEPPDEIDKWVKELNALASEMDENSAGAHPSVDLFVNENMRKKYKALARKYDVAPVIPVRDKTPLNRGFYGFVQLRSMINSPWRFYVCGFDETYSGQAGFCAVLRTDGTELSVPIDAENQITIRGRKYGPQYWTH